MGNIQTSQLLELVGRIYDCVLFPENWEPTIASMQNTFGWQNVVLGVYSFLNNGTQFQVALEIPEEYGHIVEDPSYLPDVFALWGGKSRIDAAPLEEPVLQSLMSDPKAWGDNRYFRDFAKPQGIEGRSPNSSELEIPDFSLEWFRGFPTSIDGNVMGFVPTSKSPYLDGGMLLMDAVLDRNGAPRTTPTDLGPLELR